MHSPAGNLHPQKAPPQAPKKRKKRAKKASAVIIDLNAERRARAAKANAKKNAKVVQLITVHKDASPKVKKIAKALGLKSVTEFKKSASRKNKRGWKQPTRKPH